MKIKSFLAFLDISIIDIIPQKFQRELIEIGLSKRKLFLQNVRMEELQTFHLCSVISKTINYAVKNNLNLKSVSLDSILNFNHEIKEIASKNLYSFIK